MWAEKPVFSHLWAKSEFNEILVLWLIKLIFGCVFPCPPFTYSMSWTFYIIDCITLRMSKCPQWRHSQERFRQTFICEYYEKQEAVLSQATSYTGQTKTRPWKILSHKMSSYSFSYVQRKSGVREERASFVHSNMLQTCCWHSAFLQNKRKSFLIALQRTDLSVFPLCVSFHLII